ncbi:MAG: hypothetical protein ACTHM7_14475 [Ginsengibacter sp.]
MQFLCKMSKYFLSLFVGLLSCGWVMAQSQSLQEMVKALNVYSSHHLREKVYVHTDKSYYLCGEILWFKAYVENAINNHPLSVSKIVYVELLNKAHDPVMQAKIGIKDGSGNGSFALPLTLETGNYELRAYTNWMKNDSASLFFKKIITIVNTTRNLDTTMVRNHFSYNAGFYPEGGNLVSGLKSVVAFKISNNYGKGVDAGGVIVDESNDTILHFQSFHFGMGKFEFTPASGKKYRAIISLPDSSTLVKDLPAAYASGYVMHLEDAGDILKIAVNSSGNSSSPIYLIAQTNGVVNASQMASIDNGSAQFSINKNNLEEGVVRITLFNDKRQPVCERLYFKRPSKRLIIDASPDKTVFNKRSEVKIDVSASAGKSKILPANLSVAVYRLDSIIRPQDENIFSYLWLSSDLRGYIENPDYYCEDNNPKTNEALDNLLLTQGWRRFDWNHLDDKSSFSYLPENQGHLIAGKVTNEITGEAAPNVLVYLSVPGKRVQLYGCRSDEQGMIHFNMEDFYGKGQIVLQTNYKLDSVYRIQVFTPFSDEYGGAALPWLTVSEHSADALADANLHMQIQRAYHSNELEKNYVPEIDTLPFYQKPYKTYLLDNYTRFTTMEEVMREYVAEVNVVRKNKQYHFNTFNNAGFELEKLQPSERTMMEDPLILLDGIPVFDVDKIIAYDPLKVRKLEVVASRYYRGPISAYGIVSLTTYSGDLPGFSLNPHDVILNYDGLQNQRIFYSPDYSTTASINSRLPDFRNVLFWSPEIHTDDKGQGSISFYTGDIPGKYLVEIQGISNDGYAGSTGFTFNVK